MSFTDLTRNELLAKEHFMQLIIEGNQVPIESYDGSSIYNNAGPPAWFDEQKFDLGREYFMKNRFGIMNTNMCGLILLLTIPKGLALLRATKKSSTVKTARSRYVDTIMHTLSWYEFQLKNDSKSWESLKKVRSYHWIASNQGRSQKIGFITQAEVSITTFGFAGLALIRPYLFGISTASQKERKAFLHFWATLNYLIGVEDRFNICLLPIKAAEIEFDIIMRNVLAPHLQIETLAFKHMVTALIDGLKPFVPYMDYDAQMFLVKRAVGIPGYQLDVNYTKEIPYGNILSPSDVAEVRKAQPYFSEKIKVYTIKRYGAPNINCDSYYSTTVDPFSLTQIVDYYNGGPDVLKKLMGLPCESEIRIKELDRGPSYLNHLNGKKYYSLSQQSKFNVNMYLAVISLMKYPKGVTLNNQIFDSQIDAMRNKTGVRQLIFTPNHVYPEMYMRGPGV